MIGLQKGLTILKAHDSTWIDEAKKMKKRLSILFPDTSQIEHIGSTSIPTISAKPIIDLAVGVCTFDEVDPLLQELTSLGFIYKPDIGDDTLMYFNKKNDDSLTTHHLHVLLKTSQTFKNHLYFRDYLIMHKDKADEYQALKISLANKYPTERDKYTKEKGSFIKHIVRKAQVAHFLGKEVTIEIDRPVGSVHPKHEHIFYPINYGFIPNEFAPDDEELDVYLLGIKEPVDTYKGRIIAVVHRENDVEDKLVMSHSKKRYTKNEIKQLIQFQEQYYISQVELYAEL